ncbi:MAG: hypothetical protein ABIJ16_13710 [Bacteroidota bacterium]
MQDTLYTIEHLRDHGPVYTETDTGRLIVEPWNAATAVIFFAIVIFWLIRLRGQFNRHLFLTIALPVLAIGGIGGTIYHALRISQVFLLMDWIPIVVISFMTSFYFFIRSYRKWWPALVVIAVVFFLQMLNFRFTPHGYAINISYGLMACVIIAPAILILVKTRFRFAGYFFLSVGLFLASIFFRIVDQYGWLPMGTHFLWHIFGAFACHFMILYVYKMDELKFPSVKSGAG